MGIAILKCGVRKEGKMRVKIIEKGEIYLTPELKILTYDNLKERYNGIGTYVCVGLFCGNVLMEIAELECLYDIYKKEMEDLLEVAPYKEWNPQDKFKCLERLVLYQGYLIKNDIRKILSILSKIERKLEFDKNKG
jgi:hypothetical protein